MDAANALAATPITANYQRTEKPPREWGKTLSQHERTEIHKSAKSFEKMYMSEMMNYMFTDTDMSDNMFGGGAGEQMYNSLLVNEYAGKMSGSNQATIAPVLEREILKLQELQKNPRLAHELTAAPQTPSTHLATTEAPHDASQPSQ